jgi:hypothetical protein
MEWKSSHTVSMHVNCFFQELAYHFRWSEFWTLQLLCRTVKSIARSTLELFCVP